MAKKTNKTNHVLNLLSTGVKKEETEVLEQPKENSVEMADNVEQTKDVSEEIITTESPVVSVVTKEDNTVAEQIRASLEKDFQAELEAELKESSLVEEPEDDQNHDADDEEEEKEPEDDFILVNIMEHLVNAKLLGYMERFHCCTCARCMADVKAMTLTALPSKYVVINKNAVSPLLNFYTVKYAGQIAVEITKACITVSESPRHKKE